MATVTARPKNWREAIQVLNLPSLAEAIRQHKALELGYIGRPLDWLSDLDPRIFGQGAPAAQTVKFERTPELSMTAGPSLCITQDQMDECHAADTAHQKACTRFTAGPTGECTHRRFDEFCLWHRSGNPINHS